MNEETLRHKVFLIEDNLEISRMYERVFRLSGYDVEMAYDGESALERLTKADGVPDAIVMDVVMPHMNGTEVLAAVRKDARLSRVPVVVLTNSFDRDAEQRFLDLGADVYLVKIENQSKQIVEAVDRLIFGARDA